jgi:hypothetical protein
VDSPEKQRFLDICHFKRPGDLCMMTFSLNCFWNATLQKWVKQGAPEKIVEAKFLGNYFRFQHMTSLLEIRSGIWGLEARPKTDMSHGIIIHEGLTPLVPAFKPEIITEDEHSVTLKNGGGQIQKYLKSGLDRMPTFLDWPVKDRASWNEIKKRLDPSTPERWPSDWDAYVQKINSKSEPISLEVGGFYGYLREWVGSENILYMFYDDPVLIEDMMEQMLYLETEVIKRTLKDIKVQQATFWEDMCYKAGPLISPDMIRKFILPRWKKITDLLHSYGVDVIFMDCDGNVEKLIPICLEAGINHLWPFEVAAGNDAVAIRKKYGKDLIIGGTIDKRSLMKDKKAIREEVLSKVPFLLGQGGYFPSVDHLVPPDVTFENYCYFINTMREVAGLEKIHFNN